MNERRKIVCPECKAPKGLFKVFLKITKKGKNFENVKTLVCNSCEHMFTFTVKE
mgnify:FL=1|jgi:uncharacterized protein YbaR (Trm112 family)